MTENKKHNIFDYMNAIKFKKNLNWKDKGGVTGYPLLLFFSYDERLIEMCNKINFVFFSRPDEAVYHYFWHKVPKGKRYIKFPKKKKQDKETENQIQQLMDKYDISKIEAERSLI